MQILSKKIITKEGEEGVFIGFGVLNNSTSVLYAIRNFTEIKNVNLNEVRFINEKDAKVLMSQQPNLKDETIH